MEIFSHSHLVIFAFFSYFAALNKLQFNMIKSFISCSPKLESDQLILNYAPCVKIFAWVLLFLMDTVRKSISSQDLDKLEWWSHFSKRLYTVSGTLPSTVWDFWVRIKKVQFREPSVICSNYCTRPFHIICETVPVWYGKMTNPKTANGAVSLKIGCIRCKSLFFDRNCTGKDTVRASEKTFLV